MPGRVLPAPAAATPAIRSAGGPCVAAGLQQPTTVLPAWLWLSFPIALLAVASSLSGIFFHTVYARETANWAARSVGQDIANLVLYPLLAVVAVLAARGSLRAYLTAVGLLVYSSYTFAIYAFDVHFGPLFLLYVAVLGLSVYALIGSLLSVDPSRVKGACAATAPVRQTAWALLVLASAFYLLWLSADLPDSIRNSPAKDLRDAGLFTNAVHVLDLGIFLPAMALAGVLLLRSRPFGFVLAPVMLIATIALGVGIVSLTIVVHVREGSSLTGGVLMGALAVIEAVIAYRFFAHADDELEAVLGPATIEVRSVTDRLPGP